MTMLVNVWSGPRNVSTAVMYAFRERPDTTVVDEPLYAAWLSRNPVAAHPESDHPGRAEVLASQPHDAQEVISRLLADGWPTPVVLAKQMAAHIADLDPEDGGWDWLDRARNVILCRDPAAVVASYTEQVAHPTVEGLGYPTQLRLVERALERGETPIVLDTQRLLADPRGVLTRCCQRLGLAFDEAMLSWPAGPKPEDGVWAPHWYASTHRSTGFGTPRQREIRLPAHHAAIAASARPLYEQIVAHAL